MLGITAMSAGEKEKKDNVNDIDFIIQDDEYTKGCNKSWARLIKEIINKEYKK